MSAWNSQSSRRDLIIHTVTGAAGLCFGFTLSGADRQRRGEDDKKEIGAQLHALVKIFVDNDIEIVVVKAEMGQGVLTSMAMLIVEELAASWEKVSVRLEGDIPPYYDPLSGGSPSTIGSTSVRSQHLRLRRIGAAIREVLLTAAAKKYRWPLDALEARDAQIFDRDGTFVCTFGDVAQEASSLPLPPRPQLKRPSEYKLIGTYVPHKDSRDKAEGRVVFGIDVQLPDLWHAAVRHHPAFGSRLTNFAELQAQISDPYTLIEVDQAIILIGPSYWETQRILGKLPATYALDTKMSAPIEETLAAAVASLSGESVYERGNVDAMRAKTIVRATYAVPFLAHNALEPLACVAWVTADRAEFWIPSQGPLQATMEIARVINRPSSKIKVHATFLGGGFGRKVETDFVAQAALASQAVGRPVKLIWSRQEDTQHDLYRPAFQGQLEASIDKETGRIITWEGKNAGPSIMRRFIGGTKIDSTSIEGFANIPYPIAHQRMFHQRIDSEVPVGFWRSVGLSQNCFFRESFLDELAFELKRDPLALRLEQLSDHPRALRVLTRLGELCSWAEKGQSESLGLAFVEGFGSLGATAARVAIVDGKLKVEKLWCVVDCGSVVNLNGAVAQVQGGSIFGLAAALYGKITVKDSKVEQIFFGESPLLRLSQSPDIAVDFIESGEAIGGLGEIATPLVAPAVANALFRLTGQRVRSLPLADTKYGDSPA